LSLHAIGLAIAVGSVFVLSLRLLGLYRAIPVSAVHELLNFAWVGIAINVFSGFSLFMTQASYYVTSGPFLVKISAILLGIANLAYTQRVLARELPNWQANGISMQGRYLAIISMVLWTVAVVTGRLIAYL
jgi:uncharacterized membrane protein